MEFKVSSGAQAYSLNPLFKIMSSGRLIMSSSKALANIYSISKPKNVKSQKRDAVKIFHERATANRRNIMQQKEELKKKILIVLYIF
ncbi:hypothetical protein K0B03_04125 [Patescibacteria group bacterium]|nr:hypothetical protein [Patescibacteria group bacterium]